MKKNSLFIISVLSVLCFTSCQDYSQPIRIDNKNFELTLPGFVKEEDLADDAIVEYANRFRNFYIVVFQLKDSITKDSLWLETTQRLTKSLAEHKIDSLQRGPDQIFTTIKGKFKDEILPLEIKDKKGSVIFDSDEYIIYNSFNEIPEDDLEYIWYLDCHNENITNIDFKITKSNLI